MIHGSRSRILRGKSRLHSTGVSVSEKSSDPSSAKMTVNAIGRNSLPSTAFQRQDRQVDDDDDEFAEQRRLANFDGRGRDRLAACRGPVASWAR